MNSCGDFLCDLIEQIERAFADVEFPGENNLSRSTYGSEPPLLRKEFRDKRDWRTLTTDFLNQAPGGFGSALSFFTDQAYLFYLPAYLIADIEGRLDDARSPTSRLCYSVTPLGERNKLAKIWGGGTMGDRAKKCFESFSTEQVSAIVAYLWWTLESAGSESLVVEQALENYWLDREQQK